MKKAGKFLTGAFCVVAIWVYMYLRTETRGLSRILLEDEIMADLGD